VKQLFADTFYWLASINPGDDWHNKAKAITATLDQVQIVTTDEVLTEVLTFSAARGRMRYVAVQLVKRLMKDPKILVLQQTWLKLQGKRHIPFEPAIGYPAVKSVMTRL
jgi:predicted nucleic acid-binding protein